MDAAGDLIFVSIAAYRDPQLVPTVEDCIRKASRPEQLRFGICRQRGEDEPALPFLNDWRFRILDVSWRDSRGAGWARAEIMKLWQGEDWFLQVDSHCRFVQGWDRILVGSARETGSDKAILSTYATPFTPGDNEVLGGGPLQIAFQAFTPEGIPQLKPAALPIRRDERRFVRSRFVSAGFLFSPGCFVEEVPYDPDVYFMGEEAAMTVRAFTHGYDLFHPAETIVWHDYLRAGSPKHWADHTEANQVVTCWSEIDDNSKRKVRRLLCGEPIEQFGLGRVRTLEEYEAYAGLSLQLRKAQLYTVRAEEPPNPRLCQTWTDNIHPWIARVTLPRLQLPEGSWEDPALWYLGIEDDCGYEICRIDILPEQLTTLQGTEEQIAFICEFPSETVPAAWTLWPLSRSRGWLLKTRGQFNKEDIAILKEDEDEEPI